MAIVLNLLLVIFGAIGYTFLGVREFPSVDPPIITVTTSYKGANPDIIESQITEPLEKAINGIAGIRTISSSSNQGSSRITVEFDLGEDLDAAANDVRDKVSQALRSLPDDIDGPPVVSKADANSDAIISMQIQSDTRTQLEVNDYATNVVLERIQTIPGVSSVQIWGEKRYAMRLWLDPIRMGAYQISPVEVLRALEAQNIELPAGKVSGIQTELTLKTQGRLSDPEAFNRLIVAERNGELVRFEDIGHAELGPERDETILKESGVPMVALAMVPLPGSNYIDIADEFYRRYDRLKKEVPDDIRLDIALDSTVFIRQSIEEVGETLLIAFILVVLIIYLFFRNWKIALRPLIDIPVSLISTFFIMYLMGFSINVLTLLAIVLATGLVVDDGIVVTENIYKKLEQGMNRYRAAREGAEEIYFAVIATSVTLAFVFLPIIFLQGFVGRLFREFGVVIAAAVLISSFVSLTLTPILNVWLTSKTPKAPSKFYQWSAPFFEAMDRFYRGSLRSFMQKSWLVFPLLGITGLGTALLYQSLPQELAPSEDRSNLRVIVSAPEGVSYEYMYDYMDELVQVAMDSVPEHTVVLSVTSPGFFGSGAPNTGFMRVRLVPPNERERSQNEIAGALFQDFSTLTGGRAFVVQEQTISTGQRLGRSIQFVLQNNSFEKLRAVLPEFMEAAQNSGVLVGVDSELKFNKPEMELSIDRDKAASMGVRVADINEALQLSFSGRRFGYFTLNGRQYEVIGQVALNNRDNPDDVRKVFVPNNTGEMVSLDQLIRMEEVTNPPQLYHYNRYKSAKIEADLAPGYALKDGIQVLESIADSLLDESFSTELSGASRDFQESSDNTLFAFLFALVLVYLVLAIQFESFKDPLVIMLTVPLALFGALFSLWAFGYTINIFSQIGIIMLIGLVTKNGILIVEFANQLRLKKDMEKIDAVIEAATMRLRPILMTSLATALGALPIALALGAGAQSRKPLGMAIIGGIMFSLILTLYVVPAMYAYLSGKKVKNPEKLPDEAEA